MAILDRRHPTPVSKDESTNAAGEVNRSIGEVYPIFITAADAPICEHNVTVRAWNRAATFHNWIRRYVIRLALRLRYRDTRASPVFRERRR